MWVQSLDQKDPLEEEMATHSSILVLKLPWTEASSLFNNCCKKYLKFLPQVLT